MDLALRPAMSMAMGFVIYTSADWIAQMPFFSIAAIGHLKNPRTTDTILCKDQSSTGAVFADVNGDGSLDLLVTGHRRGVRLFLNEGTGSFQESTKEWGSGRNQWKCFHGIS
jgi:hypothetical protein